MRAPVVAALLIGCSSPSSSPAVPVATTSTAPPEPPATPSRDAAVAVPDKPSKVTARVVDLIVAGPRTDAEVRTRIEAKLGELAKKCEADWSVSAAQGVRVVLTADERFVSLAGAGSGSAQLVLCLGAVLGVDRAAALPGYGEPEPTFVYATIAFEVDGKPAADLPAPPVLRNDFEHACSMFKRSGAMAETDYAKRPKLAQDYFHANVRHPALYQMAWQIAVANPADKARYQPALRARIKPSVTCEDAGW